MTKANLRFLKWIGTVLAVGVCTGCDLQFKIPTTTRRRVAGDHRISRAWRGYRSSE
jgi:hypothetical protein